MRRNRVVALAALALSVVLIAGLGTLGWVHRLELLLWAAPRLNDLRNPVAPNEPIEWPEGPATAAAAADERPPNLIVILADDMGFNDVSFYNGGAADGTLQTPRIDSIARDGVVFRHGYAANAVCAPSRASVMTGRYSTRFGFEYTPFFKIGATIAELMFEQHPQPLPPKVHHERLDELPDMKQLGMPPEEITIAELLREVGYYTAHIGKWHLGATDGMRPEDQGFANSLYLAGTAYLPEDSPEVVNAKQDFDVIDRMVWATTQYAAQFDGSHSFEPEGYLTDYYTDEAIRVIEANRNRPFFLYLAHWGIHNPLQAKKSDYDALAHIDDHRLRVYAAMIRALDRGVGRLLDELEELGLDENTLVVFTSDNGGAGYLGLPDVNQPYRGWKLTHFEGGTHVPFFAKWPARITPGSVFDAPVSHIDLLPTLATAAGARLPDDRILDGVDLLPYVRRANGRARVVDGMDGDAAGAGGNAGELEDRPHETLFWRQGYLQTVLHRDWKLITTTRPVQRWLFDLAADPTEQRNLATEKPEVVMALEDLLARHDASQAEPLWPSVIETPVLIDKTGAEPYTEGDEYGYWPN